ncbi:melanotransferrin-like [Paramacrobiotus metropolitanus]|uniref:melanotransferrin-like n=1 Tax=Paramacrobiotus metropolitanus TaxID=2943436 RepID=UPI0024464AF6|nr:melanotransferrin-like [Paramacrobiotus metropolitanus]
MRRAPGFFCGLFVLISVVSAQYNSQYNQYNPSNQYPNQNPTQSSYGYNQNAQQQQGGSNSWSNQQQQQNAGNTYGSYNTGDQQQWQVSGQQSLFNLPPGVIPLRFCTVDVSEQQQCQKMVYDIKNSPNLRSAVPDPLLNAYANRSPRQTNVGFKRFEYSCVQAVDKLECMAFIKNDIADIVLVTPGEAYVGEKDFGLQAVVAEAFGRDKLDAEDQAMAIVRTTSGITDISQLRGRRACFNSVGDTVTWDLVASYLARHANQLTQPQCHENTMDVMMKYFGEMCAPYDNRNYTDEENNRYRRLCTLCGGGGTCPHFATVAQRPDNSLNCLMQNPNADVAFVSATVLRDALGTMGNVDNYQILCPNQQPVPLRGTATGGGGGYAGQARMLDESWTECHVGRIPSSLWITRQSFQYARYAAQKFWEIHLSYQSSGQQRPQWLTSPSFFVGSYRNNAQPSGVNFKFDTVLTVDNHLGAYKAYLEDPIVCSASARAKLCTTSALELERCGLMKLAFQAHRIRPELECQPPVKNPYVCLTKINANQTDIAMVDVGDLVAAGSHFNAIQLAQERFVSRDRLGSTSSIFDEAYSVALVRDPNIRSLNDLRGKHACFSGVFEANGFMLPINALRRNGLLGHSDCQNIRAAADFFGDSCLPGLSDAELNTNVWTDDKAKLCRRCERGEQSCARGGDNKYDGEMGALNCLRDGKGDVAFVSHTVLNEIPDEQRRMFYLVCGQANSGTAQGIDSYNTCNLEKAPGGVIVTNRYKPLAEKRRLTDMLLTASSLFSADLTINNFQNVRIDLRSGAMDRARKTYHMFGKRNRTDSYLTYSSTSNFYGQTGQTGGSQYNSGNNQYNNQYQSNQYQQSTSSYYNSNNNYQQQQNQQQQSQYSNQPLSTLNTAGHYAIFSPSAYDLRGFGDDNTTHVGLALGSYRELAERSNWRVCIDTGTAARPAVAGMFSVLVMVVLSRILL